MKHHEQALEARAIQGFWPNSQQEVQPSETSPTAMPKILFSVKFQFSFRKRIPASASQFIFSLQSGVMCLSVGKRKLRSEGVCTAIQGGTKVRAHTELV